MLCYYFISSNDIISEYKYMLSTFGRKQFKQHTRQIVMWGAL